MSLGASVQIFLPAGSTDGIWVVQKSNWTGVGLVIPRSHFADARQRQELQGPGVYVLVGDAEGEAFSERIYVGESDELKKRLDDHMRSKDFWSRAIVFAAKDSSLNKAHVKQLEFRLIELANSAGRTEVENSNVGTSTTLAEADQAMLDGFLEEMLTLYPVMGLSSFEVPRTADAESKVKLFCKGPDASAEGYETADGFVVLAGALIRKRAAQSRYPSITKRLYAMHEEGLLIDENDQQWRLPADHVFSSPSMAADIVLGRSANGRTEWKTADGTTLKEIQEQALTDD